MVDVKTGEEVWDFSQPSGPASLCDATQDPRCKLNYPMAATVGMMMWGKETNFLSAASVDGYFDTATFGDTGGQLWVLRFNDPGVGYTEGGGTKVTNWYGARAFQAGLGATTPACGLDYCGSQPFFYITSNLPLAANGLYRTLAGTGDRFNLLDPLGGVCGPDNLRACLLKGCTVKLQDATGGPGATYGVETLLGTQTYEMNHPAQCLTTPTGDYVFDKTPGAAAGSCGAVTQKIDGLVITCPSAKTCSGADETTRKKVSLTCTGGSCDPTAGNELGIPIDLQGNPDKLNWFFSVQVFENSGARRIFRTADEARAYDNARLKESDLKNVNPYDTSPVPSNLGSPGDRGWSYYFNHGQSATSGAVVENIGGTNHNLFRTDERSASVSAVEYGCTFWNTMQAAVPVGAYDASSCPVNSPCKAGRAAALVPVRREPQHRRGVPHARRGLRPLPEERDARPAAHRQARRLRRRGPGELRPHLRPRAAGRRERAARRGAGPRVAHRVAAGRQGAAQVPALAEARPDHERAAARAGVRALQVRPVRAPAPSARRAAPPGRQRSMPNFASR